MLLPIETWKRQNKDVEVLNKLTWQTKITTAQLIVVFYIKKTNNVSTSCIKIDFSVNIDVYSI